MGGGHSPHLAVLSHAPTPPLHTHPPTALLTPPQWLGCSREYEYPAAQFNADYGDPLGVCSETAAGSGVFVREFTKSSVQMDCATWTPTVTFK